MATLSPRPLSPLRAPAKTVLRIGGTPVASVERHAGGEPYAEVVNEPGGLLPYAKKHIGDLRFADLEAEVAMDAHPALFGWIRDAWFGSPAREKVSLDTQDASGARTLELSHARIRAVTLPALDQASRERRFLQLQVAPRAVRRIPAPAGPFERAEREFLAHNFSVQIDGLDCSGVLAVDPLTVKTSLPEEGTAGKPQLFFPDLRLHLDPEKAGPFRAWFEDFVIAGHNDDERERSGSIAYQDPMLGEPLSVLQLLHLGIYRVADEPPSPSGPRRVLVDLYCERMELARAGG